MLWLVLQQLLLLLLLLNPLLATMPQEAFTLLKRQVVVGSMPGPEPAELRHIAASSSSVKAAQSSQ